MAGKKGMEHYPKETKIRAIGMYFEEGKTYKQITEELGIRSKGRAKVWVRQYRREGIEVFNKPKGRPRKHPVSEQSEIERLRMENALLKKFHTDMQQHMLAKRNIGPSIITGKNSR
ncbi:MAG: helix-turn-helix domain-containing protein [Anaerolineales bacterium]|nr:helix-turn-helix domain-containing protein [Anaerolineales bacterium]